MGFFKWRFKKRYFALGFFLLLFITCQMEFLAFRKSDARQREVFRKKGLTEPTFFDFQFENRNIHYLHVGADSLPLVVLVHGSPGSSSAFTDYLTDTSLTNHAQVVAVDRPGFGFSGYGKAEGSLEKQAAVLKPILEKHRASKTVLVGHSYGGPVIVRAAMDFPGLVDGLVIVAGSVDPALEPLPWWQKPLDWALIRWMLPPSWRVSNQEIIPLKNELENLLPLWEKITCPVTVLQGMKDNLVPGGNAAFAEKMLVNAAEKNIHQLDGKGHFILWTMRDTVIVEILSLMR